MDLELLKVKFYTACKLQFSVISWIMMYELVRDLFFFHERKVRTILPLRFAKGRTSLEPAPSLNMVVGGRLGEDFADAVDRDGEVELVSLAVLHLPSGNFDPVAGVVVTFHPFALNAVELDAALLVGGVPPHAPFGGLGVHAGDGGVHHQGVVVVAGAGPLHGYAQSGARPDEEILLVDSRAVLGRNVAFVMSAEVLGRRDQLDGSELLVGVGVGFELGVDDVLMRAVGLGSIAPVPGVDESAGGCAVAVIPLDGDGVVFGWVEGEWAVEDDHALILVLHDSFRDGSVHDDTHTRA